MAEVDIKRKNVTNGGQKKKTTNMIWKWGVIGGLITVLLATCLNSWRHSLNFSFIRSRCHCSENSCKYTATVEDFCCNYTTVDSINEAILHPLLQELVKTSFFRYFEIKLWYDCPFWPDDGMCQIRGCSVCEFPENEFPKSFKTSLVHVLQKDYLICQKGKPDVAVDNLWTNNDDTDNGKMTCVNLQLNPENYTGYTGSSARRIWDAVYSINCPNYSSTKSCKEKSLLYKLISGLHSSISIHIATNYLLDDNTNLQLMYDRILKHPKRVKNLYFTFVFVLRALTKAGPCLKQAQYDSGNRLEDMRAHYLIKELINDPKLKASCLFLFDESQLLQGQSGPELKQQIQKRFRNISALMDCVGCEKCRLWGKLQVLGLGTALKIMFLVDNKKQPDQPLQLQRNEVIALMNLLNRLSESIKVIADTDMGSFADMEPSDRSVGLIQRLWESWMDYWWKNVSHHYFEL